MKKITSIVLALLLVTVAVVATLSMTVWAEGTEISDEAGLKAISGNGVYTLTGNITVTEAFTVEAFSGTLDGNGYTISGLSAPLFNTLSGTVKNLTLEGSITTDVTTATGALANTVSADLTVDKVTNKVSIAAAGATNVGGFIGEVTAGSAVTVTVKNSTNIGTISGKANVAGFIGSVVNTASVYSKTTFSYCINEGAASMTSTDGNIGVGGFVGFGGKYSDVVVEYASNKGDISSKGGDNGVGGIYGGGTWTGGDAQKFTARYTSNYGNVTVPSGRGRAGGICGRMNRNGSAYVIEYCYNVGTISAANDSASGIFGYSNSSAACTVRYCYNVGTIQNASRIFSVAGHGATNSVTADENYFVGTKTNYTSENLSAIEKSDVDSLNEAILAILNTPYVVNPTQNNGYAVLAWECEHGSYDCVGNCSAGCGYNDPAEASGAHSYTASVTAPTVTEDGYTTHTCSKCSDSYTDTTVPATGTITPDGKVYAVANADQMLWLFARMNKGTVAADITIKLTADIDVAGKLPTMAKTFTGVFDGQGHELIGLSQTLLNKTSKATIQNITFRGDIVGSTNRKATTVAYDANDGLVMTNVVSYVNITSKAGDLNAGGLIGYLKHAATITDCAYNGNYSVEWTSAGGGVGGIIGWSNFDKKEAVLENCSFGGTITVTGGVADKTLYIGGIIGNITNPTATLTNCQSNGTITSSVTAGTDCVGGIVGGNTSNSNNAKILSAVNKSTVKGVNAVGGIVGAMTNTLTIDLAANYGEVSGAENCGAIVGNTNNKTLTLTNSADLSDGSTLALCGKGNATTLTNAFTASELTKGKSFVMKGVNYTVYNVGVVNTDTGMIQNTLSTEENFKPYISYKDTDTTHSLRFVILADLATEADDVTFTITFKDADGQKIKALTGKLGNGENDYRLYTAVTADGEQYFAKEGFALFGLIVTDIPDGAWASVELSVSDAVNELPLNAWSVTAADVIQ